ncbi:hypothetical protein G5B31_09175 [Rhodobacter sp. SGA-6-6]|uniref:hypothetical protein n=1 Tax=Rhodobacter sp. SGA-6-6 TaxID=2710882 RepID=UPI0013ECF298|nr:hypothetical protein [Rhodobacter sp. SGA-6-6]NGM45707.1 hypothetical protein [Rhodobacter sp. SGA-6-6]
MRRLVLALALSAAPLPALAQEMLAEYRAHSGSLPPQYAWSVTATIAADGAVALTHCTGYETEGPACTTRRGKAAAAGLQAIREAAVASGLIETPAPESDEIMVGGGSVRGRVRIDGAGIALPAQPAPEDAARVAVVLSAIRSAIPAGLAAGFLEGD